MAMNLIKGKELVRQMLQLIGEDPQRLGLKGTPQRVVKMWSQIFCGYDPKKKPKVTVFKNGRDGIFYRDMIIDKGYFFSYCEHHIVPFFGEFYFGYIPDKFIVGASKISRVIDYYSARLQVSERLVTQIVDFFESCLEPKGLVLIMSGRHLCKEMRGVKKFNSPFEVIAVRGVFADDSHACKMEFLSRISK